MTIKKIHVYDLDGVLVDTSHRYRNLPNGSIDAEYWVANHTEEKIKKDKLLPLAKQYLSDCLNPEIYTIICTGRAMDSTDIAWIIGYLGYPDKLFMVGDFEPPWTPDHILKRRELSRLFNLRQFQKLPRRLWEDNTRNITALRDLFSETFHIQSEICSNA